MNPLRTIIVLCLLTVCFSSDASAHCEYYCQSIQEALNHVTDANSRINETKELLEKSLKAEKLDHAKSIIKQVLESIELVQENLIYGEGSTSQAIENASACMPEELDYDPDETDYDPLSESYALDVNSYVINANSVLDEAHEWANKAYYAIDLKEFTDFAKKALEATNNAKMDIENAEEVAIEGC
jgi:hypothetical protein